VTLSQNPVAGTIVGVGTYTITISGTDSAGNVSTTTTTFTVNSGGLNVTFNVSPSNVKVGKVAKLDIYYNNTTGERLNVSYIVRYSSPCGDGVADSGGPWPINAGSDRTVNGQFHVPKDACTGLYTLTLETYVNGVLTGTNVAQLSVIPDVTTSRGRP
jgi:hypothetical protein